MTMFWLGGQKFNALETGNGVTASPVADTLFPVSALYDRHPERIFKYGSLTASPTMTADLDMIGGVGGFEAWSGSSPTGWTEANSGTGDVTQQSVSGTLVQSGLFSARFDAGDTSATAYLDLVVRAGQRLCFTIALRGDGGLGAVQMSIRNQGSGNYLDSAGGWGASFQEVIIGPTTAAYTIYNPTTDPNTCAFNVEGASAVGGVLTTIRVLLFNDRATTIGWADSFSIWPAIDFTSAHGHNIDPRSAPVLRGSTDNFSASNVSVATPTVRKPTLYSAFTQTPLYRYWRLAFADTNTAAIYMGEWVLGARTSFRGPALPLQVNHSDQQVRVPRRFGAPSVFGMGQSHLTSLPLTIRCESTTDRDAFFVEWQRTQGGYPVVVVPHDGDGHTNCVYGLMSDAEPESWATKTFVTLSTEVEPLPLPLITG